MKSKVLKIYKKVDALTDNGKAESKPPPLTHGLPPTPRERRDARRDAAAAEAEKSWELRRKREEKEQLGYF